MSTTRKEIGMENSEYVRDDQTLITNGSDPRESFRYFRDLMEVRQNMVNGCGISYMQV